jgi:hypothetical protein
MCVIVSLYASLVGTGSMYCWSRLCIDLLPVFEDMGKQYEDESVHYYLKI